MSVNTRNLNNTIPSQDTGVYCYWDERYVQPMPFVRVSAIDSTFFIFPDQRVSEIDDDHQAAAIRQRLRLPSNKFIVESIWGSCNTPNSGGRPPKNGLFRPDFLSR